MVNFWVGVSGFSYASWKGVFYPQGTKPDEMLSAYASKLNSVEINSSFYHMPSKATSAKWSNSTPQEFRFSFKANRKITHYKKLKGAAGEFDVFLKALTPAKQKMGCVLVQLPPYMKQDYATLETFLADKHESISVALEFREDSWFGDKLNGILSRYNAALCVADTEEMKPVFERTADFAYVRLRRDRYSKAESKTWSKNLHSFANDLTNCFVYFKHDENGDAANRSIEFSKLLGS